MLQKKDLPDNSSESIAHQQQRLHLLSLHPNFADTLKMQRMWRGLLLTLALLCLIALTGTSYAQTSFRSQWRVFREEDGLIADNILTLAATDDAIWVGSAQGISRYDGTWTNYFNAAQQPARAGEASAIVDGYVVTLAAGTAPHTLWAGSTNGQVARWDGNRWLLELELSVPIMALEEVGPLLYIGTSDGIWRYVAANAELERLSGLDEVAINDFQHDGQRLWIATERGLWSLMGTDLTHTPLPATLANQMINALWLDPSNVLWIGTTDGVFWFSVETSQWSDSVLPVTDVQGVAYPILSLTGDEFGAVWAGASGAGARKFVDYGLVTIDVARTSGGGLTTPFVFDTAVDRDGSVWFATPVGLFQYQERIWLADFQDQDSIRPEINEINDLLVDDVGTLWIATAGAGVRRKEPDRIGYTESSFTTLNSGLPDDAVLILEEDENGDIWAGTRLGLARYSGREWHPFEQMDALASPVVTALLADRETLWIGTDAGLAAYAMPTGDVTNVAELGGLTIEALAFDSQGQLWVGTDRDGIWIQALDGAWRQDKYDPSDLHSFPGQGVVANGLTHDPELPNSMWAIVEGGGLVFWNGDGWFNGDPENRLPSGLLYRIYADQNERSLWIGTEAGVAHYDGLTWGALNIEDGLQGTAIFAITQDRDGNYWFGGPDGLTRYWPDPTPPWIRFDGIHGVRMVDGVPVATRNTPIEVGLTYGDLQTPQERIELYYRTDIEPTWREVARDEVVLQPAELQSITLEVMARDLAFNYSDVATQQFAVVAPPRVATVPLLGEVDAGIFWTLLLLGGTALLGFSYVSYEIVQNRQRSIDAVKRGYNPYISGEPVRTVEMFFGRDELLQRVVDTLHNNSIMIYGERRIGKTTLLYQMTNLLQSVEDPDYWFLPVYVDLEGTGEQDFFHYLMEEIAHAASRLPDAADYLDPLSDKLHLYRTSSEAYRDRDFSTDIRRLIDALQDYGQVHYPGKRLRLILLMDEMDVMSAYDRVVQQQLRRIFMRDFSSTLGAVVAGIQISKEWDRVESPWYNLFNEIEVEPFERTTALALLQEPVRDVYRYEPAAIEFIIEQSLGRPFRIQQYALESVNQMLAEGRRKITLGDAEAAHRRIQSRYSDEDASAGLQAKTDEPPADLPDDPLTRESAHATNGNDGPEPLFEST